MFPVQFWKRDMIWALSPGSAVLGVFLCIEHCAGNFQRVMNAWSWVAKHRHDIQDLVWKYLEPILWLFPEENLLPTTLFEAAAFRVILLWGGTSYQPLEQTLWVLAKIGQSQHPPAGPEKPWLPPVPFHVGSPSCMVLLAKEVGFWSVEEPRCRSHVTGFRIGPRV